MKVQIADNGWPGIFIPGDEALAMAYLFRKMADGLQLGLVELSVVAAALRSKADQLAACRMEQQESNGLD